MITLNIDGKQISVPEGTLVIEAAKRLGIDIPYACHHRHLEPYGGCRVCLVEIERVPKPQTSCTTKVSEGMVVRTNTPAVIKARQGQIEFLLANHPLECPVCEKGGECELQALSYYHGRGESRFSEPKRHSDDYDFGPLVWRNMDRCIRCKRCIRFMDEVACERVLNFDNRGPNTVVDTFDEGRFESKYSGNTVTICPVGALLDEQYIYKARSWEASYFNTVCPHCANGCTMQVGIRRNKVLRHIVFENPDVNSAWLCDRGQFGFGFVNSDDRLSVPLIRKDGELVKSSWDEALDLIARRLTEIKEANGPDAIGGIGSTVCTNEDDYIFQKFMRAVIGTNNIDHRLNRKQTSGLSGLAGVFDYNAATGSLQGVRNAKAILLIGCDLSEEQPVTALWVREAVRWKNAHLIIANTKDVEENRFAHDLLHYRPGAEVPLISGILNIILSEKLANSNAIEQRAEGVQDLAKQVETYPRDKVAQVTGVTCGVLEEAARAFAQADGGVILFGSDILSHPHADDVIRALANLAITTGNIGKPNGGIFPILPDANSQGAIDMGVLPNMLPGHLPASDPVNRDAFSEAWKARLPHKDGLGTAEMLRAAVQGRLKALYIMGADPLTEFPDAHLALDALRELDFVVVQDIFLTKTAERADVVLPTRTYAEKDGTFTNVERRVQRLYQGTPTVGPREADWYTISRLARRMGHDWTYSHPSQIMEEIARLVHTHGGITYEWIGDTGVQWPCPTHGDPGSPVLYGDGYELAKWKLGAPEDKPFSPGDAEYPLQLLTRELLFNGDTMVRKSPGVSDLVPESWVEINPADAAQLGIPDESTVRVSSPKGSILIKARAGYTCPPGTVVIPRNLPGESATSLMDADREVDFVKVEAIA